MKTDYVNLKPRRQSNWLAAARIVYVVLSVVTGVAFILNVQGAL
jgi:hypothetical protein